MVTWSVRGPSGAGEIRLRETSGGFEVAGMGATEMARQLNGALKFIRHRLQAALSGATGTSGWSLRVSLRDAAALYGDAPGGEGGGRPSSELAACLFSVRGPDQMVPAQAVENSIRIVRDCWSR